ncbi:MAG: tetratricopeptide repeat protein, partial [Verrucomicrobiales bacterium]|nr:tetratricopeptide repeat protein [Verrucomicrobiales bacterium]
MHGTLRFIFCIRLLAAAGAFVATASCLRAQATVPNAASVADPVKLIEAGNRAYAAGDWAAAAAEFETFLQNFGSAPEAAEAVAQIKPLVALCKIRLGEYGAAGQLITEALALPKLDPKLRDELAFWKGVVLLQVQAYPEAREAFLAYYQTPEFQAARRTESILLFGTTYVMENDFAQAAAFFEQQASRLWQLNPEASLRGQTLRLHALMELGELNAARDLVATLQPHLDQVTQIVSLQGLTADLGGRFLDGGDFYSAIFCLQRVWPAARLLKHQADRVERLKRELETLKAQPGGEALLFAKKSVLTRIEREQRTFAEVKDFDLGVRMRLGFAYLGMERWREAALVLEQALTLPGVAAQQAQAGLAVIQCWQELRRYQRAISNADAWLTRFEGKVEADATARARFLMAQALYDDQQFTEAARVFEELHAKQPDHELGPQALLMAGLSHLMADAIEPALARLDEVQKQFSKLPVAEDASYWHGMARSFDGQHQACRDELEAHLKRYAQSGRYTPAAEFRRASSRFMLGDYEGAIAEFDAYLAAYPEGADAAEASVLKGDALGALGEIDAALEAYATIPAGASRTWYEQAQFKIGKIHQLRRDYAAMQAHFETFLQQHPDSPRLAEAVHWAGVALIAQDQRDAARQLYWQAISEYGNELGHQGVEDILLALPRLYPGKEDRLELLREFQRRRAVAEKAGQTGLVCRLHWAEGQLQATQNARLALADFLMAAEHIDVEKINPRVLIDCADACHRAGSTLRAGELYRDLLKWHPRAVEVERARSGLGFLAAEAGDWQEALSQFEQFAKRAVTPALIEEVDLKKAALLAAHGRTTEATAIYKDLLASKQTSGRTKALALLAWGEDLSAKDPKVATAYFERVYLAYGKQHDLAARAYLTRGRLLEKMGQPGKAAQVYAELRAQEVLAPYPEHEGAASRLKVTGPPPPPKPPPPPAA